MANSFSHIGAACVRVLARQAAINAVKSELQRQGLRVFIACQSGTSTSAPTTTFETILS